MNAKRSFGELETTILRLFREKERPMSVSDVVSFLGKDSAYTTIMTVLSRLYEKGVLTRVKEGRLYLYSMKKAPLLRRLKEKLFKAKPSEIVSYFLEEKMDLKELEKIEAMIKEHKKKWKL